MTVKCKSCNAVVISGTPCHETGCTGVLVFTKRGKNFGKWNVWSLDVWGNKKDGFEVNDRSRCGTVVIPVEPSDIDIIRALKKADKFNSKCHFKSFRVDGDDRSLSIDNARTGCPIYQLERL